MGIDVQHGANLITLTVSGLVMSNGTIRLLDGAANLGTITVRYDAAATEMLPAAFAPGATGNILLGVSWSSKD